MSEQTPGLLEKIVIGLRIRARLAGVRLTRRLQLRSLLRSAANVDTTCPVCSSRDIRGFSFDLPDEVVAKSFCRTCEHLFSERMQTGLSHVQSVFRIDQHNPGKETQVMLLREAAGLSGARNGTFLDFGVGGNIGAFAEAGKSMPEHRFMGCDVYPASVPGYFLTYDENAPHGIFDGITSHAVVEHLTNTLDAWKKFNRLLKPVSQGGGIMIHAFPSQWHLGFDNWAIRIAGHSCVFSRESLRRVCDATGFRIERADPPRPVGHHYHPVFIFRKTRDLSD
jgi:hypothetical protein